MTQRQIEDLLSLQADRLVGARAGVPMSGPTKGAQRPVESLSAEPTSVERAGLSSDDQRSLSHLMHLARRVQSVLVEVEPRPGFVADLKSRLVTRRRNEAQSATGARRGMMWVWGVAGALSLAGLGFLGYRAARAGWMAGRNPRPALPKA